jgi:hypothetical protein
MLPPTFSPLLAATHTAMRTFPIGAGARMADGSAAGAPIQVVYQRGVGVNVGHQSINASKLLDNSNQK